MDKIVEQVLNGLIQKTIQKKTIWQESSTKGEYKILFDGATLTIGYYSDNYGHPFYILKIFNNEGKLIVKEMINSSDASSALLRSLFSVAQESCLRKNETLSSILSQLNNDTTIGSDDEVLPF